MRKNGHTQHANMRTHIHTQTQCPLGPTPDQCVWAGRPLQSKASEGGGKMEEKKSLRPLIEGCVAVRVQSPPLAINEGQQVGHKAGYENAKAGKNKLAPATASTPSPSTCTHLPGLNLTPALSMLWHGVSLLNRGVTCANQLPPPPQQRCVGQRDQWLLLIAIGRGGTCGGDVVWDQLL